MADNKRGRDKQARDADDRQRERAAAEAVRRGGEVEAPIDPADLTELEMDLDSLEFPATGADIVAELGDRTVESPEGEYPLGNLVPETEETFDSPDAVRVRVERPTIAAAMKTVTEASETLPNVRLFGSQWAAYEKTFRELKAIDGDDDDEGIRAITDWIVDRIHEKETLPSSRAVRREAASFCRRNGYEVRNDEWLGI